VLNTSYDHQTYSFCIKYTNQYNLMTVQIFNEVRFIKTDHIGGSLYVHSHTSKFNTIVIKIADF